MRSVVLATTALSVCCTQDLKCDEDAVFLQGPSSPLHLLQPDDDTDDPVFLLKMAKNLARQAMRQTPEVVNAGITSIHAELEQMTTRIEEGHVRAQQRIQAQVEEIRACHRSSNHGVTRNADLRDQLATITACREDQADASQAEQVKCNAWESLASGLTFPSIPSMNILDSSSSREKYNIAVQLRDWVSLEWATVDSHSVECDTAMSHAAAETLRCTPVIERYTAVFCQHRQACSLLNSCHRHEVEIYDNLMSESETGMVSRQAQYRTVNQTGCLLQLITGALGANTTIEESVLASCDEDADVQHLELSFPEPEPSVDCPHPQREDPNCEPVQLPVAWAGGEEEPPEGPVMSMTTSREGVGPFSTAPVEDDMIFFSDNEERRFRDPMSFWLGETLFRLPEQIPAPTDIIFRTDAPVVLYALLTGVTHQNPWQWMNVNTYAGVHDGDMRNGGRIESSPWIGSSSIDGQTYWRVVESDITLHMTAPIQGGFIAKPLLSVPDCSLTDSRSTHFNKVEAQEGVSLWTDTAGPLTNVPVWMQGAILFQKPFDTPADTDFTFHTNTPVFLCLLYDHDPSRNGGWDGRMWNFMKRSQGSLQAGGRGMSSRWQVSHGETKFTAHEAWTGGVVVVPLSQANAEVWSNWQDQHIRD